MIRFIEKHQKLFTENKEAVYFDTNEELLEKVRYYLGFDEDRKAISLAGYTKTQRGKYSYDDVAGIILGLI
jgi:spore maturation protein CgeB